MKKLLLALTGILALALMLGACGEQESPAPPVIAPAPQPPPAPPPAPQPPLAPAPAKTYALPGDAVFPEGVAYDPVTNSFFTGSTGNGDVFRGDLATGQVTVFLPGGADGRTAAIGMKVDSKNRRLWVCGGGTGQMFVYNVDTGALIRKYAAPSAPSTFINDVALAPNGDAYFTDSRRPVLFKISGSGSQPGELESWLDFNGTPVVYTANATSLNGIVISPDSAYIVVVHSGARKLYRITVSIKEALEIDLGGKPQGGDGMVLDGNVLYVLERTQTGDGIVRIDMLPDLSRGAIRDSFRDASFAFPTTIAKVGDRMLVVNSQFNTRGAGLTPKLPFTVSDIPIPK